MSAAVHQIKVGDSRISYRRAGEGEPVLLLHGFPDTSYAWRKIIPQLAERYTVIAPDLLGCGASDRPSVGYEKRSVAAQLRDLVRQLDLGLTDLVAHDVGMIVGYAYACRYPHDVKRLVLMEAALAGLGPKELYDASKYPWMYHLPLFEAPNALAETMIAGRERMLVDHFMRQQAYNQDGIDPAALDEYARCLAAPGALSGGIGYFRTHAIDASRSKRPTNAGSKPSGCTRSATRITHVRST